MSLPRAAWWILTGGLAVWFASILVRPSYRWLVDNDPMMISGLAATIFGIGVSVAMDADPARMIERLRAIGVVVVSDDAMSEVVRRMSRLHRILGLGVAGALGLIMLSGYLLKHGWNPEASVSGRQIETAALVWICILAVGLRLARMVGHGFYGHVLLASGARCRPIIDHPDGAGGLGVVGRTFLGNSLPLIIPLLWLLFWMIALWGDVETVIDPAHIARYEGWGDHFARLILVNILAFAAAFILPLRAFHGAMIAWRRQFRERHVRPAERRVAAGTGSCADADGIRRMDDDIATIEAFQTIWTWPISPQTRTLFLSSVVLPAMLTVPPVLFP